MPTGIVDGGVRVFHDGRDPKTREPKGAIRRDARRRRRKRERFLRRRSALQTALRDSGIFPLLPAAQKELEKLDPYELRARALDEAIPIEQIARILLHINQRRGYLFSKNRNVKSNESGVVKVASERLDTEIAAVGARTYGEFLHIRRCRSMELSRMQAVRTRRMMSADGKIEGFEFFPERKHLEQEFFQIWSSQSKFHPTVLTDELRNLIYSIIFFQRYKGAEKPSFCRLTSEYQLARSHPLAQRLYLYEAVNNSQILLNNSSIQSLNLEQRDKIISALDRGGMSKQNETISFYKLGKIIKLQKGEKLISAKTTTLSIMRDPIVSQMSDVARFGDTWLTLTLQQQSEIVEKACINVQDMEHEDVVEWLCNEFDLDRISADHVVNAKLPEGYIPFGNTATAQIFDQMKSCVQSLDDAILDIGYDLVGLNAKGSLQELPYYGKVLPGITLGGSQREVDEEITRHGRVSNPSFHIILNQLRRLVNSIIKKHGTPCEIFVELGKDLRWSEARKKIIASASSQRNKDFNKLNELIEKMGEEQSGKNRLFLRLWLEQLSGQEIAICPFSGQEITKKMIFDGSCVIAHILPFSRTLSDDNSNRVICLKEYAIQKGNLSPFEAWGNTEGWQIIKSNFHLLPAKKRWRFAPDALTKYAEEDALHKRLSKPDGHIATVIHQYLSLICNQQISASNISVGKGQLNRFLKRRWKLETDEVFARTHSSNSPKNLETDYRVQTIDATIAAVTDTKTIAELSYASAQNEKAGKSVPPKSVDEPWFGFTNAINEHARSIIVSHRADHGVTGLGFIGLENSKTIGKLHEDTAYGFTRDGNVVHRKSLASLTLGDIRKSSGGVNLRDEHLREHLLEATKNQTGRNFTNALITFSLAMTLPNGEKNPYFGIRRVRLIEKKTLIPLSDRDGEIYKGVASGSNHRFEIWKLPDGSFATKIVSVFEAHLDEIVKPHPAAKLIQRFHKGDLIELRDSKFGPVIAKVMKFDGNGTIELVPHNEVNASTRYRKYSEDVFIRLRLGSLVQYRARRIYVDELGQTRGKSRDW